MEGYLVAFVGCGFGLAVVLNLGYGIALCCLRVDDNTDNNNTGV